MNIPKRAVEDTKEEEGITEEWAALATRIKRAGRNEDKGDHDHSVIMEIMREKPDVADEQLQEDLKDYHESKTEEDLG